MLTVPRVPVYVKNTNIRFYQWSGFSVKMWVKLFKRKRNVNINLMCAIRQEFMIDSKAIIEIARIHILIKVRAIY